MSLVLRSFCHPRSRIVLKGGFRFTHVPLLVIRVQFPWSTWCSEGGLPHPRVDSGEELLLPSCFFYPFPSVTPLCREVWPSGAVCCRHSKESQTAFLGFVLCCLVLCEEHFNGKIKDLIPKLLQGNPPQTSTALSSDLGSSAGSRAATRRGLLGSRERGQGRAAFILRCFISKALIFILFTVTWRHSGGFADGNGSHVSADPAGLRTGL